MNTVLKIFLSMSCSGSLLILALFLGKRFWKDKISRQWQYYVWLIVIARLLLPFGPEMNLMGKTYWAVERAISQADFLPGRQNSSNLPGGFPVSVDGLEQGNWGMDSSMGGMAESSVDSSVNSSTDSMANSLANSSADGLVDSMADGLVDSIADSPANSTADSMADGQANSRTEALDVNRPLQEMMSLLVNHIWLIWLAVALGMLIRKVTIYQSFVRFVNAKLTPVSKVEILDRLSISAGQAGVKRSVELGSNPLVSSPLLIGFFHPCIVLPSADIPEKDFRYIVLHELTHYRRRDMFYKWLVQITVCLHWFNPFVYLMEREIAKACEFSCDEAVLLKMGCGNAQDYGKTLLDAMAAVGKYKESLGTVTLSENKQLLKERLGAIMEFKGQSKAVKALTAGLTLCVVLGAAFVGVYSAGFAMASVAATDAVTDDDAVNAATNAADKAHATNIPSNPTPAGTDKNKKNSSESTVYGTNKRATATVTIDETTAQKPQYDSSTWTEQIERYYEADSLPLFEILFSRLDEEKQGMWLDRIYADGEISFFSVAIGQLKEDDPLIWQFAEKSYQDDAISFFSVLADEMSEEVLEVWLNRALEDKQTNFQVVLFDLLDMEEKLDAMKKEWEEEWEEKQREEYRAVGVTMDGKKGSRSIFFWISGQINPFTHWM